MGEAMPRETIDETERRRGREERLQDENAQLHAEVEYLLESRRVVDATLAHYVDLYDYAPLPLLTLDDLGIIHDLNVTATAILGGVDRSKLLRQRLRRFVVDEDQAVLTEHLRRCEGASSPVSCELRLRRPDGGALTVALLSQRPRPDARSYPTALVDLTESRRNFAEMERLVEAEKTARLASVAKYQFIAVLSHELRTPLTPVLAAASSLAARKDIDPQLRAVAEMIRRNVVTEARLIDDLLDVNRIVRGKLHLHREQVDLHDLATEAMGMVRDDVRTKSLAVIDGLAASQHWAFVDPIRMRQVLWNLLRNAVKFTPDQGRIEVRSWNRDGRIVLEVSDNGVGFDEEAAPRLFQAFEQDEGASQRFGGLGLGLAISKGVIDLHGGTIVGLSAGRGKGARFVVELDAVTAPTTELRSVPPFGDGAPEPALPSFPEPKVHVRSTPLRILLVEDDPDTGDLLHELLCEAGYEVRMVRTAQAALAAELEDIDLLLSDIGLPDGSGLDLMRALRGRRNLKGIALSGYGTEADVRASREAGFEVHLTKPIEVDGLLRVIGEVAARA
jgi:signal transduction histidine kinase